jgi:hypothetical protein
LLKWSLTFKQVLSIFLISSHKPNRFILPDHIILTIFDEDYKVCISSLLRNFMDIPVACFLFGWLVDWFIPVAPTWSTDHP